MEPKPETLPGPCIVKCQQCAQDIAIYTHAQAKFISCTGCGAYYKFKYGELQLVKKASHQNFKYCLPPGTKGSIDGALFVVISASERMDGAEVARWREYTLFNPIRGYLYLSEYYGHWILLKQSDKCLPYKPTDYDITFRTFRYHIYSKYKSSLSFAVGEFPYDVESGTKPQIIEFINPPEMLSREYTTSELRWFTGTHIEAKEVAGIFNIADIPEEKGIGQIQPQSFTLDFDSLVRITAIAAVLLLLVQVYFNNTCQDIAVFNYSNNVTDVNNNQPVTTQSFELTGGKKNLIYHLSADVDNHWLSTDVILVNDKTGESFDFAHGVEYYHGYEDGENWNEGARDADKIIEAVPSGTYHLVINPEKEPYAPDVSYGIVLHRDVPRWSNLLKAFALILIVPVIQFYRGRIFEKDRWTGSDYTPYKETE